MKKNLLSVFVILSIIISIFITPIQASQAFAEESTPKICNSISTESTDYESDDSAYISTLIELNYSVPNSLYESAPKYQSSKTAEEFSQEMKDYRDYVKEYFKTINESYANSLSLDNYDYTVSWSAPYIEIMFDDMVDYQSASEELISTLEESSLVKHAYIDNIDTTQETTQNDSSYSADYYFYKAKNDIGLRSPDGSGFGIKVGILDPGIPDDLDNFDENYYTVIGNHETEHATAMGNIIGGYYGIAPDAHLYFMAMIREESGGNIVSLSFTSCVNILVYTHYVDIINMSMNIGTGSFYTASAYSQYVDSIINTSKCMIVKSAGNTGTGNNDGKISLPGSAMNAITVGSIDRNHNISYFSATDTSDNYIFKPEVVAPGGRISEIDGLSIGDIVSGTSASAAFVTGMIAILLEDFIMLKSDPALLKSAVEIGCEKLTSQQVFFDNNSGFGLVNYENTYNYLAYHQFGTFTISGDLPYNSKVITINVTLRPGQTLDVTANWLISQWQSDRTPVFTDATIAIFDADYDYLYDSGIYYSNFSEVSYTNDSSYTLYLRICVILLEAKSANDTVEYGSVAYNIH